MSSSPNISLLVVTKQVSLQLLMVMIMPLCSFATECPNKYQETCFKEFIILSPGTVASNRPSVLASVVQGLKTVLSREAFKYECGKLLASTHKIHHKFYTDSHAQSFLK